MLRDAEFKDENVMKLVEATSRQRAFGPMWGKNQKQKAEQNDLKLAREGASWK